MGGGIDAARQPRDDAEAGVAQVARQPFGEFDAGRRGVARADDGDQRPRQHGELAAHRQQRRRIVDHLQARRIIRLAERDEVDAARARRFQFGFGVLARTDARRPRCAAAAGERGQGAKRCARAAIMIDQVAEGARADIVGADEAQPVEPLLLAQSHSLAQRRPPARYRVSIAQRAAHYNRVWRITTQGQEGGVDFAPILPSLPLSRRAILARCMIHNSALSSREQRGGARLAQQPQRQRGERAGDQGGERGVAA